MALCCEDEPTAHEIYVQDSRCRHADCMDMDMDMDVEFPHTIINGGNGEGGERKQGTSTFLQALINCLSLIYGLGIMASPYAVAHTGWVAVGISLAIALSYWYTSTLLYKCMSTYPHLQSYQDIAQLAFGKKSRVVITLLLYIEIFGTLVSYSISLGDNLNNIFPNANLHMPVGLTGKNLMIVLSALVILPTVWLRDLSALSFTSIGSVASILAIILTIFFAATIDHIGFTHPIPFIKVGGLQIAASLFVYSYNATIIFPTVCASMKNPSEFYKVMVISFIIATASIMGLGVMGASMFGEDTASQITLSMPPHLVGTKIVLWMIVITAMSKYALLLSPITNEIESLFPWNRNHNQNKNKTISKKRRIIQHLLGIVMRTMLLLLIIVMAIILPYFQYVIALIGSSMIIITSIMPCLFYLKIFYHTLKLPTTIFLLLLVCCGLFVGVAGVIASFKGLIESKSSGT